jgi:hypothetical protein
MMLQDGRALVWVSSSANITEPGTYHYDADREIVYLRPHGDGDPNKSTIVTWPTARSQKGGRKMFGGTLIHAKIVGMEFRLALGLTHGGGDEVPALGGHRYLF